MGIGKGCLYAFGGVFALGIIGALAEHGATNPVHATADQLADSSAAAVNSDAPPSPHNDAENHGDTLSNMSEAVVADTPPSPEGPAPQLAMVSFINDARRSFSEKRNQYGRGVIRNEKTKDLCGIINKSPEVKNWIGRITHVFENQTVSVNVNSGVPGYEKFSPIEFVLKFHLSGTDARQLSALNEGDMVTFSGRIEADRMMSGGCEMLFLDRSLSYDPNASLNDFTPLLIPVIPTDLSGPA